MEALEQWNRWEPSSHVNGNFFIDSIEDNDKGFILHLSPNTDMVDQNNKVTPIVLHFENSVYAFRRTDEAFRQCLIYSLNERFGKDFFINRTFFEVTNSLYLEWLTTQSGGLSKMFALRHFVLLGADIIVDIASTYEPKILVGGKIN